MLHRLTVKLGYNDHGYNKFAFITDKILPNFRSKKTSYYITVIKNTFGWSPRVRYNRV